MTWSIEVKNNTVFMYDAYTYTYNYYINYNAEYLYNNKV